MAQWVACLIHSADIEALLLAEVSQGNPWHICQCDKRA